ncbi:MAG: PEP/pyruvate-binding domain-containing protein [Candidatus Dojkabacteria bacterium]
MAKNFVSKYIIPTYEISSRDFQIVGAKGVDEFRLYKSGLPTLDGFVISTEAFDEFVHDAQIIKILSESDGKDVDDVSKKVKRSIEATQLRDLFVKGLSHEFNILNRLGKQHLLNLIPTFHTSNPLLLDIVRDRQILISDLDSFIKELKDIWAELFSKELLNSRISIENFDITSLSLLVLRIPEFEVSGKMNINSFNKELILQAEYGDVDRDLFYADEYLVDLNTNNVLEKRINIQNRMLVRKKDELISVPVSKAWQGKQKVPDTKVKALSVYAVKAEKIFKKDVSIDFGLHRGRAYFFNLKYTSVNILNQKSKEIWSTEGIIGAEKDIVEATFAEELSQISAAIPVYAEQPKIGHDEDSGFSLLKRLRGLERHSFTDEYSKQVDIVVDIKAAGSEIYGVMKKYAGVFADMGDFYDSSKKAFSLSDYYDLFKQYTTTLSGIAFQNSENPFLLKLIDYNQDKMTPLDYTEVITTELLVLKKLMDEYGHQNIDLILPAVSTVEDLVFFFKIFNTVDLQQLKKKSKVYLSITSPSFIYEINRFDFRRENLLDGIFLDLNLLMKKFFQKDSFTPRDYKLVYELLEKVVNGREHDLDLVIKVNKSNKDQIKGLLEYKPNAIVLDFLD